MIMQKFAQKDFSHYLAHVPDVQGFFDPQTNTVSYVVADPHTKVCAIIDSVLDYEPNSATTSFESADRIIAFIKEKGYTVEWILETHVHADHLSAAPYLKEVLGGKMAIGEHIVTVQELFGNVFNAGTDFARDGSQFDRLFTDGDTFMVGTIPAFALHTPGHTPVDMTFVIGNAVFVGDTLFMPDYGTARVDFPGGSAETLYESVQQLFALPEDMRMFMCHDYLPEGREEYRWETTVGEEKRHNVHIHQNITRDQFVQKRHQRDKTLGMPRLIIPSIQINMRAGNFPPEEEGNVYLTVPVNSVFSKKNTL
jgi:glyoxylase-like metal-dependent hydrolase (beta-lactamase superfamily II)